MKITLLLKNITDLATLNQGIALAKQYTSTIGLPLDFTIKTTTRNFTSVPVNNAQRVVNSVEIFQEGVAQGYVFEEDAIVCLVYDWTTVSPQPTNPAMQGLSMQIPQQFYVTYPEVFAQYFCHELAHYFFSKTGQPDITHNYAPEFSQKPRHEWYLHLIKPFVKPAVAPTPAPVTGTPIPPPLTPTSSTSRWKYFKPTEKTGSQGTVGDLNPKLVDMLDKAREIAGIPFVINSGKRQKAHNAEVGGVEDSEHLSGEGCDIKALNSNQHYLITKGLYGAGFTRISKKYATHIHAGIDTSKPQNVLF